MAGLFETIQKSTGPNKARMDHKSPLGRLADLFGIAGTKRNAKLTKALNDIEEDTAEGEDEKED